jgi:hypothetical protein
MEPLRAWLLCLLLLGLVLPGVTNRARQHSMEVRSEYLPHPQPQVHWAFGTWAGSDHLLARPLTWPHAPALRANLLLERTH